MTELHYPYNNHPAPATTREVAPGVHWLSMPMAGSLSHINLHLLDDRDGWYIVDTGTSSDETRQLWHALFAADMGRRPVKGVICTHMHPDHTGQAGMLVDHFECPLYMTQLEYLYARMFSSSGPAQFLSWQGLRHFRRAGIPGDFLDSMRSLWESRVADPDGMMGRQFPQSFVRLADGQVLTIGGRRWQIVVGAGHSPEHACLLCPSLNLLISGDQVLPVITSNVSVQPLEADANPLKDWMESLERLMELPDDLLVLPAHNLPFHGLRTRLRQLINHHEDRMLTVEETCTEPKLAVELLPVLFKRELGPPQKMMALGEALAHLHLLMYRNRIERTLHEDGTFRYRSIAPDLARRARPGRHDAPDDEPMMV